ncbi:AlbA family DNA-binding domain-containing protein [Candidatus Francisella endociliophora]|uniref:AlbA family DNA-binding domain-containing protein n=1 Tax=Candidatus Francisella endociliophora TaxID=653937 RepID=UPI0006940668|nr:ATP-binding protein [Francisella sp. FSC1006]
MKEESFKKYIEVKSDGRLKHREKKDLEFKQNYNFAAIKEGSLAKSIAAFANADGGIFIFGIKDKPREPIGMSNNNFENIEIEKITNLLNEYFSPEIKLDIYDFNIDGKKYGIFKIE